jgi:hypothetical protein
MFTEDSAGKWVLTDLYRSEMSKFLEIMP